MNYLEALKRRYSVKIFDKEKTVAPDIIKNILEAAKLSASSQGLQPYTFIIVESETMKEALIPAFYNPSQISTCSHLIVVVSKRIDEEYIARYFQHISVTRDVPLDHLVPFKRSITSHIEKLQDDEVTDWADKQAYIALANLMFAAALEHVDTCPMEGFNEAVISQILELDPGTEKVAVTLALGYRSPEDEFQKFKKVRKPSEQLFKFI